MAKTYPAPSEINSLSKVKDPREDTKALVGKKRESLHLLAFGNLHRDSELHQILPMELPAFPRGKREVKGEFVASANLSPDLLQYWVGEMDWMVDTSRIGR